MIRRPLRTRLLTSTSVRAIHGCGIAGSEIHEFQEARVGPPMIDVPEAPETDNAE